MNDNQDGHQNGCYLSLCTCRHSKLVIYYPIASSLSMNDIQDGCQNGNIKTCPEDSKLVITDRRNRKKSFHKHSALDKLLGQLGTYATWLSSIAYLQKQLRIFIFFTPRFYLSLLHEAIGNVLAYLFTPIVCLS